METPGQSVCSFCGRRPQDLAGCLEGKSGALICETCIISLMESLPGAVEDFLSSPSLTPRKPSSGRGQVSASPRSSASSSRPTGEGALSRPLLSKLPSPREIKAILDQYVIGQERAKTIIAVAVYNHYRRILSQESTRHVKLEKSNILLLGPTGCGKTLMAQVLAQFLEVPFTLGDATTITEAGYVGEDVENILLGLLHAAQFNFDAAARGIVYIDEIDKKARCSQDNPSITRDVSGEGVQQGLLKIVEGTVARIPPKGGRKHPEQEYYELDTTHILFIAGGMFEGLEQIIRARTGRRAIGFSPVRQARSLAEQEQEIGELLEQVQPEDLIKFGLIPEFVGRFPIVAVVHSLSVEQLVKVACEPRAAVVRQFQEMFRVEGAELEFTEDALIEIARKAKEKKTGARALRAIVEGFLLESMYELPDLPKACRFIVTPDVVLGRKKLKPILLEPKESKEAHKRGARTAV